MTPCRLALNSALICTAAIVCVYMMKDAVGSERALLQQGELQREFRGALAKKSSTQVAAEALRRKAYMQRLSEARAHDELLRFGFEPPKATSSSRAMKVVGDGDNRQHAEGEQKETSGEQTKLGAREMTEIVKHADELGRELQQERGTLRDALKDFHSKELEYSRLQELIRQKVAHGQKGEDEANEGKTQRVDHAEEADRDAREERSRPIQPEATQHLKREARRKLEAKSLNDQNFQRRSRSYVEAVYGLSRGSESSREGHNQLRGEMGPYSLQLESAKRYLKELSSSDGMKQKDVETSYGGSYAGDSRQPYAAVSSPNKDVDELDARVQDARDGSYLEAVFNRQ
uniref:Uncharacterized protein n=1 Tax=Guillardia theta TaxID=55529 RepID=A0A7S4HC12_GUITH|mmetsp:Transcript_13523/g.47030  ORF Transcript_13523/g.47030 Transcript_13523/m.47030 type:complete len:345 (+) Transcript_13523:198-1232(+)